jgi:hypothetical protein
MGGWYGLEMTLLEPFVAAGCWNVELGSSKWIFWHV